MTCWCCRVSIPSVDETAARVALGRLDLTIVATVPVCPACQILLNLARLQQDICGDPNAQVAAELGLQLICRRAKVRAADGRLVEHAMPHRDGLWFWSTGSPESQGGWASITERDVQEAMR